MHIAWFRLYTFGNVVIYINCKYSHIQIFTFSSIFLIQCLCTISNNKRWHICSLVFKRFSSSNVFCIQAPQYQPEYQVQQPVSTYTEPLPEDKTDYSAQYYSHQPQHSPQHQLQQQQQQLQQQQLSDDQHQYGQYEEWPRAEEQNQQYADPYWHGEHSYGGYGEVRTAAEGAGIS